MKKFREMLLLYVATQYGITEGAAAELLLTKSEDGTVDVENADLKEDALSILSSKDKERVAGLRGPDKTEIFDEAYAKAKKEVLAKAEKSLVKKYGVEGEGLKLPQIVETIVANTLETAKADPNSLDEATIKKHPFFLETEAAKNDQIAQLEERYKKEIQEIQTGYAREESLRTVLGEVSIYFDSLNPVLSKDAAKAANQKNDFLEKFKDFDYETLENGKRVVIKDGKRLEDDHANPIYLDGFVRTKAEERFDFAVQTPKGNAGNEGGAEGGKTTIPQNEDEFNMAILNATSSEERESIQAAWDSK